MKKLVARRPIRYMGQCYERGDALPAQDARMAAAWLRAGSAVWADISREDTALMGQAVRDASRRFRLNDEAAAALQELGAVLADDTGAFVGREALAEQLRSLIQRKQDGEDAAPDAPKAPAAEKKGRGR